MRMHWREKLVCGAEAVMRSFILWMDGRCMTGTRRCRINVIFSFLVCAVRYQVKSSECRSCYEEFHLVDGRKVYAGTRRCRIDVIFSFCAVR
jgi:hypothetical protein